jgi:hypothetical protein
MGELIISSIPVPQGPSTIFDQNTRQHGRTTWRHFNNFFLGLCHSASNFLKIFKRLVTSARPTRHKRMNE